MSSELLKKIGAGVVLGSAFLGSVNEGRGEMIDVVPEKDYVAQGEQSSYSVVAKTSDSILAPYPLRGVDYFLNLPSGVASVDGHDIFSDGTDTSGTYQSPSFLVGQPVSFGNIVNNSSGSIRTTNTNPPAGPDGSIVRYDFTASTDLGLHTITIPSANYTVMAGGTPTDYPVPSAERGSGTFRIAHNGDANLDGIVNGLDLSILAANWQNADPVSDSYLRGDFNGDSMVNGLDLSALAGTWGYGASGSGVSFDEAVSGYSGLGGVPEPGSLALLGAGAVGALALGRKTRKQAGQVIRPDVEHRTASRHFQS